MPYWDWVIHPCPPNELISDQILNVTGPDGGTLIVLNPFLAFDLRGKQSQFDDQWKLQTKTVRYPNEIFFPVQKMQENLQALQLQVHFSSQRCSISLKISRVAS